MNDEDVAESLPIWEDLDIDLNRAKLNGEKRAKVIGISKNVDLRQYLKDEKSRYEELDKKFKWR